MRYLINKFLLGICLLASPSLFSSEMDDRAVTEKYRVEYQDPVKLKSRLLNMLSTFEGFDGTKIERLKKQFDISDEIMRNVAVEIYHESVKALSEKSSTSTESVLNTYKGQVDIALFCLGLSADQDAKKLLMTIATNNEMEMTYRRQAISAYLRASNAGEAQTTLLRFLVEEGRLDYMERLSLYEYAKMVYDEATAEKKMAILNVLYIAVSDPNLEPWEFRVCDDILAKLSPIYAKSYQRFLLLKKYNAFTFPEKRMTTKGLLQKRLEEMKKNDSFYSISTNFTALKAYKFTLPINNGATNKLIMASPDFAPLEIVKNVNDNKNPRLFWLVMALTGFAIASIGIWVFARRR
jgi:hypothetical protein